MPSAVEKKILSSIAMNSDETSEPIEMLYLEKGAIQFIWSGGDASDGKIFVEISCEPKALNFVTIPKGELPTSTVNGTALVQMPDICYRWLRVRYTAGSNTTGSLSGYAVFK